MLDTIISSIILHSPQRKTLLTPTYINPGVLKRNLALKAGNVANLAVQPFSSFIAEKAAALFPQKLYLSGDRRFWLLFGLLAKLRPHLKYFGDSVEFEGICSFLIRTYDELRLNGISPDYLSKLQNKAKWTDVTLIFAEYEKMKNAGKFFDYGDCVIQLLKKPPSVGECYLLDHDMNSAERQLAVALNIKIIPLGGPKTEKYELEGFKCDSAYQEALQTIRNIMTDSASAVVPVRIGICTPDYPASHDLLSPVLKKLDLPDLIHFLKGEPVFGTFPGNFWKQISEWAENNFSVFRFLRVLGSSSFDRKGEDAATFYKALSYFRDSDLVLFDAGFLGAFKGYLEGKAPADPEEEVETLEKKSADVAFAIAKEFSRVHALPEADARLRTLLELFLARVRQPNQHDAIAAGRIETIVTNVLESLQAGSPGITLESLLGKVKDKLATQCINVKVPDFTRPVLGTIDDLLPYDFDTLYVIGLNEKGLPHKVFQNPVLLDAEKVELMKQVADARLLLGYDQLTTEELSFQHLISRVSKRLVLSAPLKDLGSGREMLVSRYLLDTWNKRKGTRFDYRSISAELGKDPRSKNNHIPLDPGDALYTYELGASALLASGDAKADAAILPDIFPFASQAHAFKQGCDRMKAFDRYWGVVDPGKGRALPVFSASRITSYTWCPYKYFLKYELKLDQGKDFDAKALEWLDALQYGELLHEVYYRFFVRLREEKGDGFSSVDAADRKLLDQVLDEVVREYILKVPVSSPLHHDRRLAQIRQDVEGFLQHEMPNGNARLYFELAFNMPTKEGRDPKHRREEPAEIVLRDGSRLQVRGSIDRIDKSIDGMYILLDYKTGKSKEPNDKTPFLGGQLIQAGLYSEVVGQIDPKVVDPQFVFYYATTGEEYSEYRISYGTHRNHFVGLLSAIIKELREGKFVPIADLKRDRGVCAYCDFRSVCVEGRKWRADRVKDGDMNYQRFLEIQEEKV